MNVQRVIVLLAIVGAFLFMANLLASSATGGQPSSHPAPDAEVQQQVQLLESTQDRIVLEIEMPRYTVAQRLVDGSLYDVISIPEWGLTSEAGSPQLPIRRVLVGVPLDAQIQLEVVPDQVRMAGPYEVLPAPQTVLLTEPLEGQEPWPTPPEFEKRFAMSPEVYGVDGFYPGTLARLSDVGFIRHQRVAAIELYPVQYSPVSRQIQSYSRLRIQLSFSYSKTRSASRPWPEGPVYEQLLQGQLLNYWSARDWRGMPAGLGGQAPAISTAALWPLPSEAYKIFVNRDGLYQLTYAQLAAAGLPVEALDPRKMQIFGNGQELAIRVVGEEDGEFEPADCVLFYGQGLQNKYTNRNIYWLIYGHTLGRRMPERDGRPVGGFPVPEAFTSHTVIEQNLRYSNLWPGEDSFERWYWEYVFAPEDVMTNTVDLGYLWTGAMSSTLWAHMWGYNEANHHAEFYVNGHYVAEHWWNGLDEAQWVGFDFPQSYLTDGANTIVASFPGDTGGEDAVLFDRFELDYGHAYQTDNNQLWFSQAASGAWEYHLSGFTAPEVEVYDISSPVTVTRITSLAVEQVLSAYTVRFSDTVPTTKTYVALTPDQWLSPARISLDTPSVLHESANSADYIVISHRDFLPAAETLADHRAMQGLRTYVVDLEDVYDEFGYGLSVPEAIREFLRYAFQHWQPPAPTYVVLLGDGNYDPKNHRTNSAVDYLPPYLAFVDLWLGETAADNRYVSIVGDDIWPDLVLGRLPANSLAEADAMVAKTIAYEESMSEADWNSDLVFVADNPDAAGNYYALSDDLVNNHVPSAYSTTRLYLGLTCGSEAGCRQQLINEINTGALLVNYIGHGAQILWGSGILDLSAIGLLTNADRFPIMLPMTCLEGYYIWPHVGTASLGEALVRAPQKGAVASWSPTGLGVAYGHDYLNKGFLDAVLSRGIREMGPATYAGKWRLYQAGVSLEQIEEYLVLGDPALHIPSVDVVDVRLEKAIQPPPEIRPGMILTFTLTFTNAGPDVASGVMLTDLVPSLVVDPTVIYSSPLVLSQTMGITFAWTIADLLPHSGGEIQIRGVADPGTEPPIVFVNVAEITSTTPDLVPGNNRAWVGVGLSYTYLPLIIRTH